MPTLFERGRAGIKPDGLRSTVLVAVERIVWTVGVVAVAIWGYQYVSGLIGGHREVERFALLRAAGRLETSAPDQTLWSPQRIKAWHEAITRETPPPLAVLRVPKLGLEVAVLEGTDDWTLNRAAGHIEDTALPGEDGNAGIAGHRDGFFRGLKDIARGDAIEIETLHGPELYRVERAWLVDPEDASALDPTPSRSVTLVTCYPFYFVGDAPQRFIVRAVREAPASAEAP